MRGVLIFSFAIAATAFATEWIPRGTTLVVRTDENIHIKATEGDGRVYPGTVDRDVFDKEGQLLISRGSRAELIVRRVGKDEVAVDLDSITVNGHRYGVASTEAEAEGVPSGSAKKRTGEFAAGGAVLGTILGAVAGGGKGAAIGAAAGAGAGAATGYATRGKMLNVPVETLLSFRLEQPIRVDVPDHGVDRNGYHYHDH
jgi:hypothetical protein